jgi:N utilization substance protein A
MSEIMISNEVMQYINLASKVTKTDILDCMITDEKIIFIVRKGFIGIAIGLKAKNIEKLKTLFKKNIKFVEFDEDKQKFLINLCKPYKVKQITIDGEKDSCIAKLNVDITDKSKIIGRGGKNIEIIRDLAKRHHGIRDVQIS